MRTLPETGGGKLFPRDADLGRELNPQQLAAVTAPPGPVLVIAGAGSGKTRVVTYRVAHLLRNGCRPEEVLLLTFTRKAAAEMLRRAARLVEAEVEVEKIWGGTFHHVGNLVLRRHADELGLRNDYTILDREDSRQLLDAAAGEENLDTAVPRFPRGSVLLEVLSFARNTRSRLAEALTVKEKHYRELLPEIERVCRTYERKKRELNYLDFDDLLLLFLRLLDEKPRIRRIYQERFKAVMVDEYQDTNAVQAELVDILASTHRNLTVVGDDSQSIYSFRGAEFKNIRDFPLRYRDCRVYTVEQNYRSTPEILNLANEVLRVAREGFQKNLHPVRPAGPLPVLARTRNIYHQAEFVAGRISEMRDDGIPLEGVAVLYRSHYHSLELQLELTRRGLPFSVRSGLRFFELAHIKDVCAYLKVAANPRDELAWKRLLVKLPRVGKKTADKAWKTLAAAGGGISRRSREEVAKLLPAPARAGWQRLAETVSACLSREPSPAELIEAVLEGDYPEYLMSVFPNYESRMDDLRQFSDYAARWRDLTGFLSDLALAGGDESDDGFAPPPGEAVTLSTIHQAKGLEWKAVFVIWLAEGKFPPAGCLGDPAALEEERRLFYVAVTRSEEELYLISPARAGRGGEETGLRSSRFVGELPPDSYEEWDLRYY